MRKLNANETEDEEYNVIETEQHFETECSQPKECSISGAIDAIGYGKFHILLSTAAGCAMLSDAMEMMILSVLGPTLQCSSWHVGKASVATLTTAVFLAMMIASPLWGLVTDRYGRRVALILSATFLLIFGLLTACSPTFTWLLIFRFLCGCCIACMIQCVTFLIEFTPSYARAKVNLILNAIWALGSILVVLLAWLFIDQDPEGWRLLVVLCALPLVVFLVLSYWMPESVLYLEKLNCRNKVECILRNISQINNNVAALENVKLVYKTKTTTESEDVHPDNNSAAFKHLLSDIAS